MIYTKSDKGSNFKELLHNCQGKKDKWSFYVKFTTTYRDEECETPQCGTAYRSLKNLFELCQTYYPNTTKDEVINFLVNGDETLGMSFNTMFCTTIGELVFKIKSKSTKEKMFLEYDPYNYDEHQLFEDYGVEFEEEMEGKEFSFYSLMDYYDKEIKIKELENEN